MSGPRIEAMGARVLERLGEQPGGPELLALAEQREDVELVGGAVRDLLLGRTPRELDLVVAADAGAVAQELATRMGEGESEVIVHERFGTALVSTRAVRVDVATRRAESYPEPGSLPQVRAGTPEEDLLRRDFTVNAIALGLGGAQRGHLRQAPGALEDLMAGRLRVLHEQSFEDDPTRLLRMARYSARLCFAAEPHTVELAREALAAGVLSTVSGARLGAELRLALAEQSGYRALVVLDEAGVLEALHPSLSFDRALFERALELLPEEFGGTGLLTLAVLVLPLILREEEHSGVQARQLLDRLEFPHAERDRAVRTAVAVMPLCHALPLCESSSELYVALHREPIEAVVLAGALGVGDERELEAVARATDLWLTHLRHVTLRITGEDLVAAGVPEGPEIGNRLLATLLLRVNGQLEDERESQLRMALQLPVLALDSPDSRA